MDSMYAYIKGELAEKNIDSIVVEAAGGLRAVGSVLSCEDFQILLLLDRDLNDKVS